MKNTKKKNRIFPTGFHMNIRDFKNGLNFMILSFLFVTLCYMHRYSNVIFIMAFLELNYILAKYLRIVIRM